MTYIHTKIYSGTPASNKVSYTGIKDSGSIEETLYYYFPNANATKGINPKILKQVDLKLDDGLHWNGRVRVGCHGKTDTGAASDTTGGYTDYDYVIENGKRCTGLYYAL